MKIFFIVLDGAADWKIELLGEKTPLQKAKTPALNQLALVGEQSLIEILPESMVPETDSGLMALLGYSPIQFYCGRGTLETIGLGLNQQYKYFAGFRINFASLDFQKDILDRRTARDLSKDELVLLTQEIKKNASLSMFDGILFDLLSFGKHRGILCFLSNRVELSGNVSNTDPGFEKKGYFSEPKTRFRMQIQKSVPLDDSRAASITAEILNDFTIQCTKILSNSEVNLKRVLEGKEPSNCIIARDGGTQPYAMPSFFEKYHSSITLYGSLPCERALAKLIKGNFRYLEQLDLQLDGLYLKKLAQNLVKSTSDIVFCHLKGPDEPGHEHDPIGKIKAIELIDNWFFSEIIKNKGKDDIVVVTCDHMTPCELGIHSADKVPLLISGGNIQPDNTKKFDEYNASQGKCKVTKAIEVLNYVIGDKE